MNSMETTLLGELVISGKFAMRVNISKCQLQFPSCKYELKLVSGNELYEHFSTSKLGSSECAMRIAVLGCYESGASTVAGTLSYLGVDMGGPFWGDHFESIELAQALRQWWSEPKLIAAMPMRQRQQHLKSWINSRQLRAESVGAMHPLLSLSGGDLVAAWGVETKFVWCHRSLDDATKALERLGWWSDAKGIQKSLYQSQETFFESHSHLKVEFEEFGQQPRRDVEFLVESLQLGVMKGQIELAVEWLQNRRAKNKTTSGDYQKSAGISKKMIASRPQKIVATMLSGNSEAIVVEAVKSVVDWIDELCLIDTGITDKTIQQVAGIAGEKFCLRSFAWCNDFAAARNAALEFADERKATWALTVDTDERFVFSGMADRRGLLEILNSDHEVQAWMVAARDGSYSKERFIRIPTTTKWQGRTHEALTAEGKLTRKLMIGCCFWEEVKSTNGYQHKVQRDLAVLIEETEKSPLNPRWWYYLGQTYEGLKEYRKAVESYDRCIRLDGWPEESAWACYAAARCLVALNEYREAEEYCSLGMARKPSSAELPWLAGWCCFQRGQLQPAITWAKLAVMLGRENEAQNAATFRHVPAWYEAPWDVLRFAYKQLGRLQEAEQAELEYKNAKEDRLKYFPVALQR